MFSDDDTLWLELCWSRTRRQLINLVLAEAGMVFEQLERPTPDWRPVTEALARRAEAGRRAARGPSPYPTLLTMLGDPGPLYDVLEASAAYILNADAPEAALRKLMQRAAARLRAALSPENANRKRVWSQLDRISRDLAAGPGHNTGRCDSAHFKAVAAHIAAHHGADRNLPRTQETIAEYFMRFCPDCAALPRDLEDREDEPGDTTDSNAHFEEYDASGLPMAELKARFLEECLEPLPEAHALALLSKYGEGSRMSAMDSLGLGRKAFATLLIKIEKTVSDCVTEKARLLGAGPTVAVLRWEKL